jgi:arsenate reductase
MKTVLFACVQNAGRSQMAAALFNALADPGVACAISAGTRPATRVHEEVVVALREIGNDVSNVVPRLLTDDVARSADLLVTMGCGAECPVVPGVPREDWPLDDPAGQPPEHVRAIRDEIRARVAVLLHREGWADRRPGGPMLTRMQEQLSKACRELGLHIDLDFELSLASGRRLVALARIQELGAPNGMLILSSVDPIAHASDEITEAGYGYSVLSQPRSSEGYSSQGCIDMFSDWGWSGNANRRPAWMLVLPDEPPA